MLLLFVVFVVVADTRGSSFPPPPANDSKALLMELIRDIANELDVTALCHKILINVCTFTQADRSSVFLVRGPK